MRERGREGGREGGRERGRERGREGGREGVIISFVCGLCLNTLLYNTCGLEPSDVCNVFVEHFDHLILEYSLVCICIVANPMKSFTHGEEGREGRREGRGGEGREGLEGRVKKREWRERAKTDLEQVLRNSLLFHL